MIELSAAYYYRKITSMRLNIKIHNYLLLFALIGAAIPTGLVQAEDLPDSAYVSGFYGRAQSYNLSCEARSAADLAGFWDVSVSEDEILDLLGSSDNPNKGFVGYKNDYWGSIPPSSYGVHADPIADALQDLGLKAHSEFGISMDDLEQQIADGQPVIVWVIGAMWNGTPLRIEFKDKEQGMVAAYEHTVVLTGYSEDIVQVFDPYYGSYQTYYRSAFENSWAVLGNMAVTVTGLKSEDEAAVETDDQSDGPESLVQDANNENMYVVQPGDYLIELGKRFGVDWRWLVEINQLPYPWTLFPGQVIRIK